MKTHPSAVVFILMLILFALGPVDAQCPLGDLNGDCKVDVADLGILSDQWLAPPDRTADLNGNDKVDLGDFGFLAADWRMQGLPLFINEIQASNAETAQDAQQEYDDWIEIYNGGDEPLDIGGMYLTDDLSVPTQWQVPSDDPQHTTVAAHGHLLIWTDGDTEDSGLHANFSLDAAGEEIALFDTDGTTLIDYVDFANQETDISYGRLPDGGRLWQPLASPTPAAENVAIYEGFVAKPEFSIEGGFYTGEIQVALTTPTDGATIYYTTDGGLPYEMTGRFRSGKVYTEPLHIAETTCLRARAIKTGWRSSATKTGTYLFLEDVLVQSPSGQRPGSSWPSGQVNGQTIDYGMDPAVVNDPAYSDLIDDALLAIPSISLVTDLNNLFDTSIGIYSHPSSSGRSWERPVSVELLNPDGSEGFQIDAGLRIRGGFSRSTSNPKHAFRLLFRPEYGGTLEFPLFGDEGVDHFDNVDLRTSQNYSWSFQGDRQNTMVREVFSRDVQGQMGQPYTRSRYYHLYLNGQYWGLYQTQERSEASHAESYLGGKKEDYDVIKSESGSYSISNTDGNLEAYRRLYDAAMTRLADDESYYRVQGLNPDGTRNPEYERLLDVDNLIDLMIIDYYTGDRDGPGSRFTNRPNNIYGIYNRENPDGWKWFQHDGEHTLGVSSSETNLVTPFTTAGSQWRYFNPHWLHEQLARYNENYRMRFADHVYRHFFNDGVLTADASIARIKRRAEQIELAIIAESARWGDSKRSSPYTKQHWENEVNRIIDDYLPTRAQVVLGQFRSVGWYPDIDPPTFNQHGGYVGSGFGLQIAASGGTIYYTLDGADPRTPTGANVSASATLYAGSIPLTQSTRVKARALSGATWSALNEATFAVGPVAENLRISEMMYHPDDPNTEYIELANLGVETINLSLAAFTNGIDFVFSNIELAPGDYTLVVEDMAAFEARYGAGLPIAGQFTGSLDNAGERLELRDAAGQVIQSFRFQDNWYDVTDGQGFSLTVREPLMLEDPNALNNKAAWRPSANLGGSPGFDDAGVVPNPSAVVINELMANPETDGPDWIELHNTTDAAIDVGGWFLSDDADDIAKYEIAAGTTIAPYDYIVFFDDEHFGAANAPGCHVPFGLSRNGETLHLRSGSDGIATGYSEQQTFEASESGVSLGRHLKSTGAYDFVALSQPTPNLINADPRVGPLVITEIMYNPADAGGAEYVELQNISDTAVTLYDAAQNAPWRLTDDPDNPGIEYLFSSTVPVTLTPGEYVVLVSDLNAFSAVYSVAPGTRVLAWDGGKLANGNETVQLSKPGDLSTDGTRNWIRADRVAYSDGSHPEDFAGDLDPWPSAADGQGSSLGRVDPAAYGNDPANWQAMTPSPGQANIE